MTRSNQTLRMLRFESLSERTLMAVDLAGIADSAIAAAEVIVDTTSPSNALEVVSVNSATNSNPVDAHDVNTDGVVDEVDTRKLIETLELQGAHQLPEAASESRVSLDVNRDGWLAPSDVLQVINEITLRNAELADADVEIRLEVADSSGSPLDTRFQINWLATRTTR